MTQRSLRQFEHAVLLLGVRCVGKESAWHNARFPMSKDIVASFFLAE